MVFAPGAGVLVMDELTDTRGNSAGPSVDADAAAQKLKIKAELTLMKVDDRRTNELLINAETRMLTSYSLVELIFLGRKP
jgi:hypothetical protein